MGQNDRGRKMRPPKNRLEKAMVEAAPAIMDFEYGEIGGGLRPKGYKALKDEQLAFFSKNERELLRHVIKAVAKSLGIPKEKLKEKVGNGS